jgi:SAM-dependent methyltransferase
MGLKSLLAHPLTKGLDLDAPQTTDLRLQIIESKPFLRRIYNDWYGLIRAAIPPGKGSVLELGSGAGYFQQFVPDAIQSEVFLCRNINLVADARRLPFREHCLKAIVMTDVFHHIPNVEEFLREAIRCLRPDGRIVMVEPWVSKWSKIIYGNLHHEPFQPEAAAWEIPAGGPLSGANGALPWIVFERDRQLLLSTFPQLRIEEIRPMMPFRYLVSGGVSMRNLMPEMLYGVWAGVESAVSPWMKKLAMFSLIKVTRT